MMNYLGIYSTDLRLSDQKKLWLLSLQETAGKMVHARFTTDIGESLYDFLRSIPGGYLPLSCNMDDREIDAALRDNLRKAKAPFRIVSKLFHHHYQGKIKEVLGQIRWREIVGLEEVNDVLWYLIEYPDDWKARLAKGEKRLQQIEDTAS